MLDWDKPLNQQGKLWELIKENFPYEEVPNGSKSVRDLLTSLGGKGGNAEKRLEKIGIPGIRYLDQGSRTSGKGTYNYVVFSDKDVKILERE